MRPSRREYEAASAPISGNWALTRSGASSAAMDALLDVYDTLRTPLPWACASLAAAAYGLYRKRGGSRHKPLPEFFIGAHAAVSNLSVLTRDSRPYKSNFARLEVIAP
jgi:predicted nucleic acid-binding protein